jgi:hypothetical protein
MSFFAIVLLFFVSPSLSPSLFILIFILSFILKRMRKRDEEKDEDEDEDGEEEMLIITVYKYSVLKEHGQTSTNRESVLILSLLFLSLLFLSPHLFAVRVMSQSLKPGNDNPFSLHIYIVSQNKSGHLFFTIPKQ